MRRPQLDLRTRGSFLLLAAIGCAAYIMYRASLGQPAVAAWLPLVIFLIGAIHYFRRARR